MSLGIWGKLEWGHSRAVNYKTAHIRAGNADSGGALIRETSLEGEVDVDAGMERVRFDELGVLPTAVVRNPDTSSS